MTEITDFMNDLRERKNDDLFYEYPDKNLKRIESALKLQELVKEWEKEIKQVITEGHSEPITIVWLLYKLQSLVEESEK